MSLAHCVGRGDTERRPEVTDLPTPRKTLLRSGFRQAVVVSTPCPAIGMDQTGSKLTN